MFSTPLGIQLSLGALLFSSSFFSLLVNFRTMPFKLLQESCLETLDHPYTHCKYQFIKCSLFVYLVKGENNRKVTT